MSRLNLARKYRPQSLSELVGQSNVVKILMEALRADRIAPAYLLSGPRGVGKTSTARIFARAASCLSKDLENRACGECASCKAIQNGKSMDIVEIDGASHTGVDDIRSIIDAIAYRPSLGSRNVYIIDEVHMLSNAAFNALLKTLEEPPSHALFLFATTEPEKLPSTILSRVQRLELRRFSETDILKNLLMICKAENIVASNEILHQIGAAADGALRDAQTLLEQMVLLSEGLNIKAEVVDSFLGTVGADKEIELLELISKRDSKKMLTQISQFFAKGKDLSKLNYRLVHWVKALLIIKATGDEDLVKEEYPIEFLSRLKESFVEWSLEDCDRLFETLWAGYERTKKTDLPRVSLEACLMRACRIPHTADLLRLMKEIETSGISTAPAPSFPEQTQATKPAPSTPAAPPPQRERAPRNEARVENEIRSSSPIAAGDIDALLEELKKHRPSLYALASCAQEKVWTGNSISLAFNDGHFALKQLSEPLMRQELEKVFKNLSSSELKLSIEASKREAKETERPKKRTDFIKEARKQIVNDPNVQAAAKILNAKVSKVTVEGIKT